MFKTKTVLMSALVAALFAACSETGTRTEVPTTSTPDGLVAYPVENAPEPKATPEAALDKTLPAGATGTKIDVREYEPMPMPVHKEEPETKTPEPEGDVISFNLETGEERRLSAPPLTALAATPASAMTPGSPGVNEKMPEGALEPLNFGGLSKTSDPTLWPQSTNVKIFASFPDGNTVSCSGQLYDAKWVITAGHCVFDKPRGGQAKPIIVVPGYRPDSGFGDTIGLEDFHDQPFGAAKGVWSYAYSDWRNNEDFDHDIGWIELDRPVGILSGWEGFGYTQDCNLFKAPSFYNYSYPGESYGGQEMYYRSGSFDKCETYSNEKYSHIWYGYEVKFNQSGYKGQSGSTFVKNGGILAVHSTGDYDAVSAPRITAGKYSNMVKWRNDKKPDTVDTLAMDVNTGKKIYKYGDPLDLNFLLYNYSKASYNSHFGFWVYLSTNDLISPYDTRLGYFQPSGRITLSPDQTLRTGPASGSLKVPACLPNGSDHYFLGVITNMFGGGDSNTSNNDTSDNDAQEVFLAGPKCQ